MVNFFLKLMHIQNGGRYQHFFNSFWSRWCPKNNISESQSPVTLFDGKTPWLHSENNWFVILGQPDENDGKAFRYEKYVPAAILWYLWVMIDVISNFFDLALSKKRLSQKTFWTTIMSQKKMSWKDACYQKDHIVPSRRPSCISFLHRRGENGPTYSIPLPPNGSLF